MTATRASIARSPEALLAYDTDGDGILNETEWAAVRAANADGTLVLPERSEHPAGGSHGARSLPEVLQPYDIDSDRMLNEEEMVAVKAAIADGSLVLPERSQGGGGHSGLRARRALSTFWGEPGVIPMRQHGRPAVGVPLGARVSRFEGQNSHTPS